MFSFLVDNLFISYYTKRLNIYSDVREFMTTDKPSILDEHTAAHVAELFRSFSDTSRVRILSALTTSELNVGALAELVGIGESAVSHHMRGLRQMNLVKSHRSGKEVFYRIEDEHIITLFNQGVKHVQNG
jgi:ArsR family transcriptional regulator, lead/cadmium/zinc/bismuth-responsive transcriptional repressor